MSKNPEDLKNQVESDWFVGAIHFDGSVQESLKFVADQLSRKHTFIDQLQTKLCGNSQDSDRLTRMGREIKELENTLRFRLGILRAERPASWFRTIQRKDFGPFRSSMLISPVFGDYLQEDFELVQESIKNSWSKSRVELLGFNKEQDSLWKVLLEKREQLTRLALFDAPFEALNFDNLPESLPAEFESRSLRAFLINVRTEYLSIKDRLQLCFDQLWSSSERLWEYQQQVVRKDNEAKARFRRRQSASSQNSRGSQRRFSDRELGSTYTDVIAMRYMGFEKKPADDDLKKRYREMAKQLHPDRQGGNEERFKKLTEAYRTLADKKVVKQV